MKNLFTLICITAIFCFFSSTVKSQCVADTTFINSGPGVYPSALSDGCLNQNYTDTITVVTLADTTITVPFPPFVLTVPLDSFHIDDVSNLPPGLTYTCGNANCMYYPNGNGDPLIGCAEVFGFPTSSLANDSVAVTITGFVTILGSVTTLSLIRYTTLDFTGSATSSSFADSGCGTYTINGQTYTVSGNYVQVFTSSFGCDSSLLLDITIIDVDETVSLNGNTLTANASGATYQWIDCDNGNNPIANETNQSYTATASGNYAVIVTENGCAETSPCTAVNIIGIDEINQVLGLTVYPNPVNQSAVVSWQMDKSETASVTVFNQLGQKIYFEIPETASCILLTADWNAGIYFLEVSVDGMISRMKLIKN